MNSSLVRAYRVPAMTLLMVAGILFALFGVWRLAMYSGPMLAENFMEAAESSSGDRPLALYNLGVQQYKLQRYPIAKEVLTEAFNELTKNTGVVPPDKKELGAQIQFMLGVVNEHDKKFRVAVSAYEESLRLNPDNFYAKYNLERLKSKFPDLGNGKGPGDPQNPQDPSKGSSNNKKGI